MRLNLIMAGLLLLCVTVSLHAADQEAPGNVIFNGKDLSGWKLRPDQTDKQSHWNIVAAVKLQQGMPSLLDSQPGTGVLFNGGDGKGQDVMTDATYGDCELHVEFLAPTPANSGIFFLGRYELQILDSFGKKDSEIEPRDCGGIYRTAAPRKNASKAPGEWQSFDVVFRAPRFDAKGEKTASARFVKVVHNGVVIHEDVEVKGPNAGASLAGPEVPQGPLMLQGTQTPIAFRNIRIKPVSDK